MLSIITCKLAARAGIDADNQTPLQPCYNRVLGPQHVPPFNKCSVMYLLIVHAFHSQITSVPIPRRNIIRKLIPKLDDGSVGLRYV